MRVAVIGAGIAGLAAAWELAGRAPAAEVTVLDPGPPGGKIRTTGFAGRPVDEGPDAFLTRVPEAVGLCRELGLEAELVAPEAGASMLWWGERLHRLPDGLVLGVPRRLGGLARSGLLSPSGKARAALDLVLPRRGDPDADTSVFDLVAGRFGAQVAARLVDPLVGGIHAGRTEELSAAATVPQLAAAARRTRSLALGLRAAAPAGAGGPLFLTPRGGLGRLVAALVAGLEERGVSFETAASGAIRSLPGGRVAVDGHEDFDAAVVATPAPAAAGLLATADPGTARGLRAIPYASVVLVTASFPAAALGAPGGVNGFLVPRAAGRLMTACSFASAKWPHWAPPGQAVVRMSAGRSGDTRAFDLDDAALVERLAGELGEALGRALPAPTEARVSRWPGSFPQYLVGHLDRVAALEAGLARSVPGVALAGAAYRGSGIPACIASGRRAAGLVAERLGVPA